MSFPPANTNGAAAPTAAAGVRCVLVHPRGQSVPGDLLTSLSRRVKHISVCADAYAAMAEVCMAAERAATTPSLILLLVQPEQIPDAGELLAALPTYVPEVVCWKFDSRANPKLSPCVETNAKTVMARGEAAAEVPGRSPVESMDDRRRSSPGEQSAEVSLPRQPRLAPATSSATTPAQPSKLQPVVRVAAAPAPAMSAVSNGAKRLATGSGEGPVAGAGATGGAGGSGRSILTPEELRMLLGDDPVEPQV